MKIQRDFYCRMTLRLCTLILFWGSSHCCYKCFTTPEERTSICRFIRSLDKMAEIECLEKLRNGFAPLDDISIPYSLIIKIKVYLMSFHKVVKEIQKSLPPHDWKRAFENKIGDYMNGVKEIISHKPVEDCKPPCGIQKAARKFKCSECAEEDCMLPVMCPIENINVMELNKTVMKCNVSFTLPSYISILWRFARYVKVTDLSFFTYMHRGEELNVLIKPTRSFHQGTYSCEIIDDDDDIIAEKFFFVNVTQARFKSESKFQNFFMMMAKSNITPDPEEVTQGYVSFKQVFQPEKLSVRTRIIITGAIALVALLLTLLVGAAFHYATDVD